MTRDELKRNVFAAIDRRAEEIIGLGERIRKQPEASRLGYVLPAKALAAMAVDLLADGAAGAREVLTGPRPPMTRQGYLVFQRGIARRELYDGGDST